MLRGTECSGIFLKVTLGFMDFINGPILQGWMIFTFRFILPVLSSNFTLTHVRRRPFFFLKIFLGSWLSLDSLTAESDRKDWQRNKERWVTCNRGPLGTQTVDLVVTWRASYRLLLLLDLSFD